LGVYSAKGGVGKTATVSNLGAALSQRLKGKVIIVETNMTASNLGLHLGIVDPPIVVQDVIYGRVRTDDAIVKTDYGLHVLPGSVAFTEELGPIDLSALLETLRKRYEMIILDSAPGFAHEVLAGLKVCDEILICCQPQVPAIAGTLQTFRVADRLKLPVFGVVLTRVTRKRYEVPVSDIRRTLGWPTLVEIPEDDMVPESITRGIPVVLYAPSAPAALEYRKLAQMVVTHLRAKKRVSPKRKRKVKGVKRKAARKG
jgi:MinD-like ATPase involved in chromosome partitioning or flagellar assembly